VRVVECEQGTPEWHLMRLGKATTSEFPKILTPPKAKKDKEAGRLSATALGYLYDVTAEILLGNAVHRGVTEWQDAFSQYRWESRATAWGHEMEPLAVAEYGKRFPGKEVERIGFIELEGLPIGSSTDGLVNHDGILEVKCPWNTKNHVEYCRQGYIPRQYVAQVQGELWVSGRQWCDFVTFDQRLCEGDDMGVIHVERDEEFITSLAHVVLDFVALLPEHEPWDIDPTEMDEIDWSTS